MKKLLLVLFMMFVLVGCKEDKGSNEFDEAVLNMKGLDNYTYSVLMVTKDSDTKFELTTLVDGDKSYRFNEFVSVYEFSIDGVVHQLEGECNVYEQAIFEDDEDDYIPFDLANEDFDFNGEYYIAKELEEDMVSFKIKIENGYITEMLYELIRNDLTTTSSWTYSDFNTTEVIISDCAYE